MQPNLPRLSNNQRNWLMVTSYLAFCAYAGYEIHKMRVNAETARQFIAEAQERLDNGDPEEWFAVVPGEPEIVASSQEAEE